MQIESMSAGESNKERKGGLVERKTCCPDLPTYSVETWLEIIDESAVGC
jgi:hypothetical protein